MGMSDAPQSRTRASQEAPAATGTAVEARDTPAPALEPFVDPYKQVLNPFELPANTVAAGHILAGGNVEVSEDVPISDERVAQATEAIAAHQENVQATVDAVGEDPRLGGPKAEGAAVTPLHNVAGEKTTGAAQQAQKARDEQAKEREKQAKEQAKAQEAAQKEADKAAEAQAKAAEGADK